MQNKQLRNSEIAEYLRPWYPVVSGVMQMALRDTVATVPLIGVPRRGERANIFHAAAREGFRAVCDQVQPLLTLVEEPDGKGLDLVVVDMGAPFALRWGKYNGVTISRNDTDRQATIQEQGLLFGWVPDEEINDLSVATVGYTVEDDHTELGLPCWWLGRLALLRERAEASEFIENLEVFQKPARLTPNAEPPSAREVAHRAESDELRRIADGVKRRIA